MSTKEKLLAKIASTDDQKVLEDIDRWIPSTVDVASAEIYTEIDPQCLLETLRISLRLQFIDLQVLNKYNEEIRKVF